MLLIAPQTTEFATKVAVLGALALVCAARPVVELLVASRLGRSWAPGRARAVALALGGAAAFAALVVLAGIPARTDTAVRERARPRPRGAAGGQRSSRRRASPPSSTGRRRSGSPATSSPTSAAEAEALAERDQALAAEAAAGPRLAALWEQMDAAGGEVAVPDYNVERVELTLEPGDGQSQPLVVAKLTGTMALTTYSGSPPEVGAGGRPDRRSSRRSSWSSRATAT